MNELNQAATEGGSGVQPVRPRRGRKPKQGNTELFNEVLSAANALSVSERTRLVKSLAGQLSMVVVGSGELLERAVSAPKKKDEKKSAEGTHRPNPLRGTSFEVAKDQAYKALVEAKKASPGAKLPENHPAVIQYGSALAAYKAEHKRLQPVDVAGIPVQKPSSKKTKARTTTERSPEPKQKTSIIGALRNAVGATTASKKVKNPDQMEEDNDAL